MTDKNQLAEKQLISAIRKDCLRQAQTAQTKLNDVVECLTEGNHFGALGSFEGLDDDIVTLKLFLTRIARLTLSKTKPADPSHVQPKPTAK
jgi:hypothetical protein